MGCCRTRLTALPTAMSTVCILADISRLNPKFALESANTCLLAASARLQRKTWRCAQVPMERQSLAKSRARRSFLSNTWTIWVAILT